MNAGSELNQTLDAVARGQTEAFGRVVSDYALPLRSYLASQVYHLEDVDDLAQDVFLSAMESLDGFRRGDDFWAWLRGIARHKLLTYFRSRARRNRAMERFRESILEAVRAELEEGAADRPDAVEYLLRCIGLLPERLRAVVRAGLDGHKPTELAERFGTTVGAIYNLHYRANQLLRACVEKGPR